MTKTPLGYGFWPSAWTAAKAAAASRDYAELRAGHGGLFWVEYRPEEARCTLWFRGEGAARCLTPPGFSVCSRVYEYGGGAFCMTAQGLAFVNEADQQVYRQAMADPAAPPIALTARPNCRYGDLQHAAAGEALLAVEEEHAEDGVQHRLVRLSLADGRRRVIVEGADFYTSPTLSPDGRRLAWIEWDRPAQPWTATRLCLAPVDGAGQLGEPSILAGAQGGESLQQPRFSADGRLYCLSDRNGWWQPWVEVQGELHPVGCAARAEPVTEPVTAPALGSHGAAYTEPPPMPRAEHAAAPWQLGACSYLPLEEGGLLLTRMEDGCGLLIERAADGRERCLAGEFSRFRQLAADATHYYCIAGAPDRLPAILAIERASGAVEVLAGGERPLAEADLSRPEPLRFASAAGEQAHAFFYPPRNAAHAGPPGELPPLVLFVHGGPTSACYPVFDPRIQFWTQRGFAVADLNYRGSSGFGRAYRERLHGQWGVIDVEDAGALLRHLGETGRIDPARAFIRGASAGGYTALCTLAGGAGFCGGASLYGVSDPLALRRVTHKFEADYLDWLIGDPERDAERYRARTPLHQAGRIQAPLIFFQGGLDAVVPPEQTEAMVAALRARQIPVEYRLYPNERHGFRQSANLADALEREWRFYRRLLATG